MPQTIILFEKATLLDAGKTVFRELSWRLRAGEVWAVVGPSGSGKTSFLKALSGAYLLQHGTVRYNFQNAATPITDFEDLPDGAFAFVPFQEMTSFNYQAHYYQQRYQATESGEGASVREFLDLEEGDEQKAGYRQILTLVDVARLLPASFISLSNGETRRVRLAKALFSTPRLLLLDQPFAGLDTVARDIISGYLQRIADAGAHIVLTPGSGQIPDFVTHVLELKNNEVIKALPRREWKPADRRTILPLVELPMLRFERKKRTPQFQTAVELRNIFVRYGEKTILKNINWTVRRGEKWALTGPNGSGKSTLLSLLYGDHPQAYSNFIFILDRRRDRGESIWEIKKKIGFLSPELQFYFDVGLTCEAAAASGLFDSMRVERPLSKRERYNLNGLFDFFGLAAYRPAPFDEAPAGVRRVILLIRALIKDPPILILDEPFQQMDDFFFRRSTELLRQFCTEEKTLILVTHYPHEIPHFVDRVFNLK